MDELEKIEKKNWNYAAVESLYQKLQCNCEEIILLYDEDALMYDIFLHELFSKLDENEFAITKVAVSVYNTYGDIENIIKLCVDKDVQHIYAIGGEDTLDIASYVSVAGYYNEELYQLFFETEQYENHIPIELYQTVDEDCLLN